VTHIASTQSGEESELRGRNLTGRNRGRRHAQARLSVLAVRQWSLRSPFDFAHNPGRQGSIVQIEVPRLHTPRAPRLQGPTTLPLRFDAAARAPRFQATRERRLGWVRGKALRIYSATWRENRAGSFLATRRPWWRSGAFFNDLCGVVAIA
jgi:hypothetical protein